MNEVLPMPIPTQVSIRKDLLTSLAEIERVAVACARSGYYSDVKDASQAVVKMLAGREMGIGPIQALAGIHIIEGKPTAGANLIAANVKRSGRYNYRVKERTDNCCTLEWFDSGASVGFSSFSMEDAKRAGLTTKKGPPPDGKNNWQKYPRAMCFARALTEGVRVYCPDAGAGVIYTPEELRPDLEVSEDGEVIDSTAITPEPKEPTPPPHNNNSAGQRLLTAMRRRCEEFGFDEITDAQRALDSICRQLEIKKSLPELEENEKAILVQIRQWEPPKQENGTYGTSPADMRRIHAWVNDTLGYRGQEGHDLLHAALPEGIESLSELPLTEEQTLMERARELAQAQNEAEGNAF